MNHILNRTPFLMLVSEAFGSLRIKRMNLSTWMALLAAVVTLAGGALGAVAAVLAAREQQRDQQESAKKINELNQTIHSLNAKLYL